MAEQKMLKYLNQRTHLISGPFGLPYFHLYTIDPNLLLFPKNRNSNDVSLNRRCPKLILTRPVEPYSSTTAERLVADGSKSSVATEDPGIWRGLVEQTYAGVLVARYGRVQSVKLLGRSGGAGGGGGGKEEDAGGGGGGGVCATVSFMDIKSAAKAHHSEQKLDERSLTTEYHEPAAIPCPGTGTLYSGSGPPNPPGASTGSRFSSHG
ncbi:unnamed protein product [Nesidiocoris tenuis]|uniref:Uncharacterized protein n=1 Tax=Nesidiocoris tenuis TaxID=355587 RepID=A0A6H5H0X0_9HEMI|nr:unnamed protein product [Nesidiocoris tenuis]